MYWLLRVGFVQCAGNYGSDFFTIKPTRSTNFLNLLRHETVHFSDSSSAHHQEFIHCTLGIYMSYRFVDSFRAGSHAPARKLSTNMYDIQMPSVQ